jgi:hypothetical protein
VQNFRFDGIAAQEEERLTLLYLLPNTTVLKDVKDDVGIDVALAAILFEERVIERSSWFEFLPGVNVKTCFAEDLIVYKAFADRPRDWVDIEGILAHQGSAFGPAID